MSGVRRPKVKLVGTDSNVFALMGKCCAALERDGQYDRADELALAIQEQAEDYDHALRIMMEFVEVS